MFATDTAIPFTSSMTVLKLLCQNAKQNPTSTGNRRVFTYATMQKLVFIAHGLYLAKYSSPLIKESVLVTEQGPIFEDIENERQSNHEVNSDAITEYSSQDLGIEQSAYDFIKMIFDIYVLEKKFPCEKLDYYTIGLNSDWHSIYEIAVAADDFVLPNSIIQTRFEDDLETNYLTSYDVNAFRHHHKKTAA